MTPEEFAAERRNLVDDLIAFLLELFQGLGSWRDVDQDVFLEQAIPVVRGTQSALASLTSAWVAQQASEALGVPVAPPALPDSVAVNLRKGIDDTEVYRRPFTQLYTALSDGEPLTSAVDAGTKRLREIAELDLQQTYAVSSRAAMTALEREPTWWRRVLVGPENCALCVVASTQRYRVETLNPIHGGCDCAVAPQFGEDPGQVIDEDRLEQVHAAVEELTGVTDRGGRTPDYRKITVRMVEEHGELGPMLARPRDRFTGPGDIEPGSRPE